MTPETKDGDKSAKKEIVSKHLKIHLQKESENNAVENTAAPIAAKAEIHQSIAKQSDGSDSACPRIPTRGGCERDLEIEAASGGGESGTNGEIATEHKDARSKERLRTKESSKTIQNPLLKIFTPTQGKSKIPPLKTADAKTEDPVGNSSGTNVANIVLKLEEF